MVIRRKVKRVVDKDTFETHRKINGSNFVRIAGMDGAEINTALGRKQKEQMKRKIQGRTVTLQPVGRSYGRVVAKVRYKRRLLR